MGGRDAPARMRSSYLSRVSTASSQSCVSQRVAQSTRRRMETSGHRCMQQGNAQRAALAAPTLILGPGSARRIGCYVSHDDASRRTTLHPCLSTHAGIMILFGTLCAGRNCCRTQQSPVHDIQTHLLPSFRTTTLDHRRPRRAQCQSCLPLEF